MSKTLADLMLEAIVNDPRSYTDFARDHNIPSRSLIYQWLRGEKRISIERLESLADDLGYEWKLERKGAK